MYPVFFNYCFEIVSFEIISGRRNRQARGGVAQQPSGYAARESAVSSGEVPPGTKALHSVGQTPYRWVPLRYLFF